MPESCSFRNAKCHFCGKEDTQNGLVSARKDFWIQKVKVHQIPDYEESAGAEIKTVNELGQDYESVSVFPVNNIETNVSKK